MPNVISTATDTLAAIGTDLETGCPQGSVLSPFLCRVSLDPVLRLIFPFNYSIIVNAAGLNLWNNNGLRSNGSLQLKR